MMFGQDQGAWKQTDTCGYTFTPSQEQRSYQSFLVEWPKYARRITEVHRSSWGEFESRGSWSDYQACEQWFPFLRIQTDQIGPITKTPYTQRWFAPRPQTSAPTVPVSVQVSCVRKAVEKKTSLKHVWHCIFDLDFCSFLQVHKII